MIEIVNAHKRRISIGQVWQANERLQAVRVTGFVWPATRIGGEVGVRTTDLITRKTRIILVDGFRTGPHGWSLLKEAA